MNYQLSNKVVTETVDNGRCLVKITPENKKEIFWNIVNAGITGGISFLSIALATEEITFKSIIIALGASGLAALILFRDYWETEKPEYSSKLFKFL
jgi:hypothetical protein